MNNLTIEFSFPQHGGKESLIYLTLGVVLQVYDHKLRSSNPYQKWLRIKLNLYQEEILGHLIALKYIVYEVKVCDAHLHTVVDECISPCIGSSCCSGNKHSILLISLTDTLELSPRDEEKSSTQVD